MRDIGKNIRDLRIQKKLTQDELAQMLFVTRQTVSNYETGKSRPDIDMLERIAETLEVDIHQILYGAVAPVETKNLRRLKASGLLTILAGIVCGVSAPYLETLRRTHLIGGPAYLQYFLLYPLFFLFLGWTCAHLMGMALKKRPLSHTWTAFLRWILVVLVGFYFFMVLSFLIPFLIGEYRFLHATGNRSLSDYLYIPKYADLFFDFLFSHIFARFTPEASAFTLPLGALLWALGFPNFRPSTENN